MNQDGAMETASFKRVRGARDSASTTDLTTGRVLVVGVGNELLSDDGVGIHAIRELQREPMPGVEMVELGTAILHGIELLENASRVLVIDAAKGGQPPGTVYFFEPNGPPSFQFMKSVHAMGLREAATLLLAGPLPPMAVIGVEPETLDYGMSLSAPVKAALPHAVSLARDTVARWSCAKRAPSAPALAET